MSHQIDIATINELARGRFGAFDTACPFCGPTKRKLASQRKKVLRIWRLEPIFATFHCARCGKHGFVRDGSSTTRPNAAAIARARAEAAERERITAAERLAKARWLWSKRKPITGTPAEVYLREARGYTGKNPPTLGYLPTRGEHGRAMIAAFGMATEPEPRQLAVADAELRGVHITRLKRDGSGKAGTAADKVMIGMSISSPIMLAPVNDLLGLAIAEGIENALSAHEATGLGAWAAGSASRLSALADAVPKHIEAVTLLVDDDKDGRRYAGELRDRLIVRGIKEVRFALADNGIARAA
jgi:transposase-like protein